MKTAVVAGLAVVALFGIGLVAASMAMAPGGMGGGMMGGGTGGMMGGDMQGTHDQMHEGMDSGMHDECPCCENAQDDPNA